MCLERRMPFFLGSRFVREGMKKKRQNRSLFFFLDEKKQKSDTELWIMKSTVHNLLKILC